MAAFSLLADRCLPFPSRRQTHTLATRAHDHELSEKCGDEVFRVELLAAGDFRTDASLNQYCQEDAAQHCPDVEPGEGRVQDCLVRSLPLALHLT